MELDINFSICILLLSKNNLELLCALDNSFKIVETIDYSLNIDLSARVWYCYVKLKRLEKNFQCNFMHYNIAY